MLPVVWVLMVFAPTTKTPPAWYPWRVSETKEVCMERAPHDLEDWGGKEIPKWKCEPYRH
jgi:hypothetical protein